MKRDLRKLFEEERSVNFERQPDHEDQFMKRLQAELPEKKLRRFPVYQIAAAVVLFISIGLLTRYFAMDTQPNTTYSIAQVSPELNEFEAFYISSINTEIENIENSSENRAIVKRYMRRLQYLKDEHEALTEEINEQGPSSATIEASIDNLKLQLELLQELKEELTKSDEPEDGKEKHIQI